MKKLIFQYTDYRKFLQDYYNYTKEQDRHFTYRFMSEHVGFKSAGHFTKIIKGETNISIELALRFAKFIKFTQRQTDYFQALVLFNQAKSSVEKKRYFDKMLSFKEASIEHVGTQKYEFFEKWYYSVVREILAYLPFKDDYERLAGMVEPPITALEAKRSIEILQQLGFIKQDETGVYRQANPIIAADPVISNVAINNYMLASLDLAKRAVDKFPREQRQLSSTLITVSEDTLAKMMEMTREFRKTLLKIAEEDEKPQRVSMLMFQLFPVSNPLQESSLKTGDPESINNNPDIRSEIQ